MKSLKNPKTSLLLIALCLGLTVSMNSFGQKANFAGTYNLNESKSNLGDGPMRPAFAMTVAQDDKTLTTDRKSKGRDGEDRVQTAKYALDGSVTESTGMMNSVSKSTATWSADQKSLTIKTTTTFNRDGETMEMKSTEIWTLGADGTLNIDSTRETPMGEMKLTLVYDKAK
ncbi:MAG TPA: hypothetical protein VHO72_18080 [Bacteroidales bacterium]|nr:hypothetical protein [Bacteroidales bacterium]